MRIHGWIIVLALVLSGCGKSDLVGEVEDTKVMPTTFRVADASRLEFVDSKSADAWEWKILRDKKTEKEWLIIHDTYRMVVVPFDSTTAVSVGMGD